jgi:hypothetical protein
MNEIIKITESDAAHVCDARLQEDEGGLEAPRRQGRELLAEKKAFKEAQRL